MDILYYISSGGKIGTEGTHVFEVLNNLSTMGHSARYVNGKVYSPILARQPRLGMEDSHRKSLWGRAKGLLAASPLRGEALLLLSFLKEIGLFLSALGTVLRRRPDVIYRRHSHFNSDYLLARLFNIPSIKEVNAIGVDEFRMTGRADRLTLRMYDIMERFNMPRADRIIVVTPELKELLHSEYGVEPGKISVILNGANTDLFRPMNATSAREKLALNPDARYVCFVGLLERWQGVDYLIRALPLIVEKCPETQLLVVGDGPLKPALVALAGEAGVSSRVTFTGRVPYEKVPLYINASDVCAAPFVKELNRKGGLCSLKMHEYLACGRPCVISRLKGTQTMEEYGCLSLVEPEDVAQLAAAISSLLQNGELRKQMGDRGRTYVVEHQSWEKVTERVAEVLQDARRTHPGIKSPVSI